MGKSATLARSHWEPEEVGIHTDPKQTRAEYRYALAELIGALRRMHGRKSLSARVEDRMRAAEMLLEKDRPPAPELDPADEWRDA